MRFLTLVWLKLQELLTLRVLMLILLLLPPLIGLVAGSANLANRRPDVALAVIDREQNETSQAVVASLRAHDWTVQVLPEEQAVQQLLRQAVDGILVIEAGFAQSLIDLKTPRLTFQPAEGSLVTGLVREAVASAVFPFYSRDSLLLRIRQRYTELGEAVPDDLEQNYDRAAAEYALGPARLDFIYIGTITSPDVLTFVVNEYSMEVFFLSIYAILGTLFLAGDELRRRLVVSKNGLGFDYAATLTALTGLGLVQILFYSVAMNLMMDAPLSGAVIGILAVFLVLMLGLGQVFALLPASLRLYASLLLLLMAAIGGGCFFQLSEGMLNQFGQYLPHGWALSLIHGYPAQPPLRVLLLALLLLAGGYLLQRHRAHQPL